MGRRIRRHDICVYCYLHICHLKHKTVVAYLLLSVCIRNSNQHLSITFGAGGQDKAYSESVNTYKQQVNSA